ncbi:unnamed protein product [Nesidiocoris tenuis]|uniref:MSP domain-containing protein n=1 Tax=Nesidiocoris tenuis TaxID=355587 RepID=A0A6H5HA01_9HEMI|nr:unnamed protein product [Nesidiocoris tenuis]
MTCPSIQNGKADGSRINQLLDLLLRKMPEKAKPSLHERNSFLPIPSSNIHGGIVMLYNPCAHRFLVQQLREVVRNCLYKHIITPYHLDEDRPLAVLAWGYSLTMAEPDRTAVVDFIQSRANRGPEMIDSDGKYDLYLKSPASSYSQLGGGICTHNPLDVKVICESTSHFALTSQKSGQHRKLVNGITTPFTIAFRPDAPRDYTHRLLVVTQFSEIVVPVYGDEMFVKLVSMASQGNVRLQDDKMDFETHAGTRSQSVLKLFNDTDHPLSFKWLRHNDPIDDIDFVAKDYYKAENVLNQVLFSFLGSPISQTIHVENKSPISTSFRVAVPDDGSTPSVPAWAFAKAHVHAASNRSKSSFKRPQEFRIMPNSGVLMPYGHVDIEVCEKPLKFIFIAIVLKMLSKFWCLM